MYNKMVHLDSYCGLLLRLILCRRLNIKPVQVSQVPKKKKKAVSKYVRSFCLEMHKLSFRGLVLIQDLHTDRFMTQRRDFLDKRG